MVNKLGEWVPGISEGVSGGEGGSEVVIEGGEWAF
tara:strand:+ start:6598 stop:6702 length:105 start_codon:yes stop_codon:yes gene_type:complete